MTRRTRTAIAVACYLSFGACNNAPVPVPVAAAAPAEPAEPSVGDEPLEDGLPSLDALGQAVVDALNDRDEAALAALAVTRDEYTGRLFPAIANHPAAEAMGRDLLWDMHARQSRDDMQRALDRHGGANLRFIRLEPRGLVRRAGVAFHERPRVIVADARGEEQKLQLLASVLEHEATHTFKLLGYRDHD